MTLDAYTDARVIGWWPLDNPSSLLDTPPINPLTRLREATEARATAEKEWRDAIRVAMEARDGYTVADVVEASGVSRPRVYQIVEEGR